MPFEVINGTCLFEMWLDKCVSSDENTIVSCGKAGFCEYTATKRKCHYKNTSVPSGMTYSTSLSKIWLDNLVSSGENAIAPCGRARFLSMKSEQATLNFFLWCPAVKHCKSE